MWIILFQLYSMRKILATLTSKDFYIKGDVSLGNLEIIYVGENSID